jgi:hypothetical protein
LVEARAPLSRLLSNINLADLLHLGLERCAVDTNFLSGCDLYIDEIVAMSTPVIDELYFSPSDGEGITVNVRGSISNANLSGQLKRLIFGGYRKTTFDLKDLDFDVRFDIVPEHPASVRLETEQSDIELNIGSIRVVESNNLAAYLVPVFKEAIEFLLNQQLFLVVAGNYFEDLAVPLSAGIVGIDVNDDGQDDARYNVNADIQNLDVIGNGNLLANLSVSVTPLNPISDREILGYRVLGGEASPGEPDLPYADIEMKLNADFFSQLLAAAYQGGLEQALDIDLKVSDFGTFASQLTGLGLQLDTPVATSLAFGAPPEIVLGDPQADASKFMVLLPKTSLRIAAPFGAGEMELVSFVGDLYLDASVSPKGDGQLSIDFGNDILRIDISQVNGGVLYEQLSWLPEDVALGVLGGILPTIARQLKPAVNQLVNALARPDLDISKIMGDWFGVPFVAEISAKGSIQEIVQDQSGESLTLGVDISFTD